MLFHVLPCLSVFFRAEDIVWRDIPNDDQVRTIFQYQSCSRRIENVYENSNVNYEEGNHERRPAKVS